jgi:hypothetical protein
MLDFQARIIEVLREITYEQNVYNFRNAPVFLLCKRIIF